MAADLLQALNALADKWERIAATHGVRQFTGNDHLLFANELRAILAAAPAPAAAEPVAWQYRYRQEGPSGFTYNTFRHPIEDMGRSPDEIEWWVYGVNPNPLYAAPLPGEVDKVEQIGALLFRDWQVPDMGEHGPHAFYREQIARLVAKPAETLALYAEPAPEPVATVTMGVRKVMGSRMTFTALTDAGKALPAGKHNLYASPVPTPTQPAVGDGLARFAHIAPLLRDLATSGECDTLTHAEVGDLRSLADALTAAGKGA
jgi:hypothetical protein